MVRASNAKELALIAQEIGTEVIQERLQQDRGEENRPIRDVEEWLEGQGS